VLSRWRSAEAPALQLADNDRRARRLGREHDVVRLFIGLQDEVFDRNLTDAHAARGDPLGRGSSGLGDGRGGPVDDQDVAGNAPRGDRSCRRAGPAADLKDARVRCERERVHDRRKVGRQAGRHEPESTD
jgi:hypothetical protein